MFAPSLPAQLIHATLRPVFNLSFKDALLALLQRLIEQKAFETSDLRSVIPAIHEAQHCIVDACRSVRGK